MVGWSRRSREAQERFSEMRLESQREKVITNEQKLVRLVEERLESKTAGETSRQRAIEIINAVRGYSSFWQMFIHGRM